MKYQLNYTKEQNNCCKSHEKNLKKKLNIREKEVNELKNVFNTNISIKSQFSSQGYDGKEEDNNSKEIKEILPYEENNYNIMNKRQIKPKSFSRIERKLISYNNNSKRNLFQTNNSNKGYNTNNKNISTMIYYNSKNTNNSSKLKMKYKYKTIANIFTGNSSKRAKNDSSIKINHHKIRPSYYHSINSFRGKKIDKSDSKSLISRSKCISKSKSKIFLQEETNNSKNHLVNTNKTYINSYHNKSESENLLNKNKILINYNTNIINTNVSINKVTIKQKMKDIKKVIDEKIKEITRNKKNNIHRTISAIYEKRGNVQLLNDKIRTNRESSFRHKASSHKLVIKTKKNYDNGSNKYNSNSFRRKLQNFTLQHKNKKMQKAKIKYKNKSNSMFNAKNKSNEEINKNNNKIFSVQDSGSEKLDGRIYLNKNKIYKMIKIRKHGSVGNINNKIIFKKNSILKNNDKTILDQQHNVIMTYRKNNNLNRISLFREKMSKNHSKSKKKQIDLNNNNKMNSSLSKFSINKCLSNSNIS